MTFDLYLPPFHHASILFLLKRANMENFFDFTKLQGDTCTIIPLSYDHHDELSEAVIVSEWPTIKTHLTFLKGKYGA